MTFGSSWRALKKRCSSSGFRNLSLDCVRYFFMPMVGFGKSKPHSIPLFITWRSRVKALLAAWIPFVSLSFINADSISTQFIPGRFGQSYPREAEIYELSQKGRGLQGEERKELYGQIAQILLDEAYTVPLYNGINTVAYNSQLSGVEAHCLGYYNFRYWSWK